MTADRLPGSLVAVEVDVTRSRSGSQLVDLRAATKARTPSPRFVVGSITPVETVENTPEPRSPVNEKRRIPECRDTEHSATLDVSAFNGMLDAVSPDDTPNETPARSPETSVVLAKGIIIEDTSSSNESSPPAPKTEAGESPKKFDGPKRPHYGRKLSPEVNARVLVVRKEDLLGKTVVGILSPRGGNGHFIKWNHREPDTVFVSSKLIDECLTKGWEPGMKVTCRIEGIGPNYVQADRQHPFTKKVDYFVPVPARKPGFTPTSRGPSRAPSTNGESSFFNLATGSRSRSASRAPSARSGLTTPLPASAQSSRKGSFGTGWQKQGGLTPDKRSRNGSFMTSRGVSPCSSRTPSAPSSPRTQGGFRCRDGRNNRGPAQKFTSVRPGRGGKPKSNFVFSHSSRGVHSTADNPMALGRSDTVRCWRK